MLTLPRNPTLAGYSPTLESRYSQNLGLYLPYSENGGSVIRDISGVNIGTIHGTVAWQSSPVGPALTLDGSTTWVEISANPQFNTLYASGVSGIFTISAWCYFHSASETYSVLYSEEDSGSFNQAFLIKSDATVALYTAAGAADPVSGVTLNVDKWNHLCWAYGAEGNNLYVNGVRTNIGAYGTITPSGSAFRLRMGGGSIFGSGRYMNGAISNIGKWMRQLSASEVQQLWQEPMSVYKPFRRVWYFSSGNAALQLTFSDSLSLSDTELLTLGIVESKSDSLSLTDSAALDLRGSTFNNIVDFLSISDSTSLVLGMNLDVRDSLSLTDSPNVALGLLLATFDTITLSDHVDLFSRISLGFGDGLVFSDAAQERAPIMAGINPSDTILLTDLIQKFSAGFISVSDQITLIDVMTLSMQGPTTALGISVGDSLVLIDSFLMNFNSTLLRFTDSLNLQDSVKIHLATTLTTYLRRYLNDVIGDGNP